MSVISGVDTQRLSRRHFLQGISVVLGAAAIGLDPFTSDARTALAAVGPTLPPGSPVVVVIDLAGGNDILNMHVPFSVPNTTGYYRAARPNIAITRLTSTRPYGPPPAGDYLPPALDLDGAWALHGALPWLANRWHSRRDVAIIQGTGENVVREMSHFAAFAYRWAGAFSGNSMNTGWLGRYNDAQSNTQPLGAISLGGLSQELAGLVSPNVSLSDLGSFGFNVSNVPDRTAWLNQLNALGDLASPGPSKVAVAAKALNNARVAMAAAASVPRLSSPASAGQLGSQLATAASLISAGVPCQTYVATLGGFDDHSGEPYAHWDRLTALDAALSAFFALIDATPRAPDVFVMLHSEFGRQVSQNAGLGTDHGLGSSTFLIGGGAKGGLYGQFPDLSPSARHFDAMVPTVDFRTVYATVLNRLGASPGLTDQALGRDESGQVFGDLGVFASGPTPLPPPTTAGGATTTAASATTTMPATTMPATTTPATTTPATTTPATTTLAPTTTIPATTTLAPLRAPTGFKASSLRRGRLTLGWQSVTGAGSYSVWIDGQPMLTDLRSRYATITGLTSGRVLSVAVRAHDGGTSSPPSESVTLAIK